MANKTLQNLIDEFGFVCHTGADQLTRVPESAYVSDLLSDVMGQAQPGMLWITSQIHKNIVAVASLIELSAVIIVHEREPDPGMLKLAEKEGVTVLTSGRAAFETAGLIYNFLQQ